jgi:acyl-CoA reductase-like NAD-dependent aldehyde dehydrogenase
MVEMATDPLPKLDFGPLINSKKVEELRVLNVDALSKGAISPFEGTVQKSMIFPGQDISAYVGPAALLNIPRNSKLYHSEPFGPLDTIVVVDHLEELISEITAA